MRKFSFLGLFDLISLRMGIGIFISVFGAYLCHRFNIIADYPLSFISVAIVFPIVFSINAAFTRRENALKTYAEFKGLCTALIFATKDWEKKESTKDLTPEVLEQIESVISSMKAFFVSHTIDIATVYNEFHKLSQVLQELRLQISNSEMSRVNQYLSKMLISFEQIATIKNYRSSVYLANYGRIVVFLFPIFYAPYFGHHVAEFHPGLLGYSLPIIYTTVLFALQNVHDKIEDPLNGLGLDDLKFEQPPWEKLEK